MQNAKTQFSQVNTAFQAPKVLNIQEFYFIFAMINI